MNTQFINLKTSLLSLIILFTMTTTAWSAIYHKPQIARTVTGKQILYKVSSEDLNSMKDALIQINLHMRENMDQKKPKTMVAIYGPGVQLFHRSSIDEELRFMLEWFYEEDVIVGVSKVWMHKLKMVTDDLADGLAVLESLRPVE